MRWLIVLAMIGSLNAQSPAISMQIGTETGEMQFRVGQAIGLTLTFGNSSADTWMVSITGRDRSVLGLESDGFPVSPAEGTSDPMRYRFGQAVAYSGPGGIFLGGKTAVVQVDLNQWVRFERPGFYRVHALFHARSQPGGRSVTVESNDIGIEIIAADPAWEAGELRDAVGIISTTVQDNQTFDKIMNAARRIWYLDTPDSIRESGRLLGTSQVQVGQILRSGLLASAHRKDAAATLKQLLRNPDQPVSRQFLETLAGLDGVDVRTLQKELAEVVGQKRDNAKAISMKTLIDYMPPEPAPSAFSAEAAHLFSKLPTDRQAELLGSQWEKIAGPEMIPVLREIYDTTPDTIYGTPPLVASAVERLFELDPAQGRTLILNEIRRPVPRLPYKTLAILPDATLPGMDKLLAEHLQQNQSTEELIARYATPAILEPVKAYYAKRDSAMRTRTSYPTPSCDAPLVGYFLRTDAAWGQHVLEGLIAERGYPNGPCWAGIVGRTAVYYSGPEWEKIATAALGDSTVVVKSDAVKALGRYGSPASESAVWESFRYWHEWWKDKPSELNEENRRFEQVFLDSIAHAKNWNITSVDLGKVRDLCITQDCRGRAEEYRRERDRN